MAGAKTFRTFLISTIAAGALCAPAFADDASTAALEARIAEMEAMLAELRAEIDAARQANTAMTDRVSELEARPVPVAQAAPEVTAAASPAGNGFMAGDTRVSYGGFIDIDAHVTDLSDGDIAPTSIARDFYIPGAIPVGGMGDGEPDTDFTAQGSRFFFTTSTPTDFGDVTSRLEFDFLGSPGGDERVSNSYNPRLRVGWVQLGDWRFGQDWSTFQNTAAIPESASFLVASDGMIFVRQALVRYTRGNFQFALENADSTVTPATGLGRIDAGDGAMPDVVARYNFTGDFGNISLSAVGRNLALEMPGVDGNAFGWGLAAQGRINVGDSSDIRFSLAGGEGLGRYIGLNAVNGAIVNASGDLEAIPVWGGLVALRHDIGGGRRFNLGYSRLEADNDMTLSAPTATRRVHSAFANYMVTIGGGVTLGAEILLGERVLENGESGSITRATFSTKYSF
jgi:hypothetical protein